MFVLLDVGKPAHATAFMTASQPQYTHKEAPDKWLRAPWAHHASQSRYTPFSQALIAHDLGGPNLRVFVPEVGKPAHATAFMTASQPQYTHKEGSTR